MLTKTTGETIYKSTKLYTVIMSHWDQMNPKVFSKILHSLLNYHVYPVTSVKNNIYFQKINIKWFTQFNSA